MLGHITAAPFTLCEREVTEHTLKKRVPSLLLPAGAVMCPVSVAVCVCERVCLLAAPLHVCSAGYQSTVLTFSTADSTFM